MMIIHFVNEIEHHPEGMFTRAEIIARTIRKGQSTPKKESTLKKWFNAIGAFLSKRSAHRQALQHSGMKRRNAC